MQKRLFIAIDLKLNEENWQYIEHLKAKLFFCKARWVNAENMHLTLQFLGSTDSNLIPQITSELENIAKNFNQFELKLNRIGFFGQNFAPKILWLGFEKNLILSKLVKEINIKMLGIGFQLEKRSFSPHLTLARIKYSDPHVHFTEFLKNINININQQFIISNYKLIESQLTPQGANYKTLKIFFLKS